MEENIELTLLLSASTQSRMYTYVASNATSALYWSCSEVCLNLSTIKL
jgi:hypothetical protein